MCTIITNKKHIYLTSNQVLPRPEWMKVMTSKLAQDDVMVDNKRVCMLKGRGFVQQEGIDCEETFSPTLRPDEWMKVMTSKFSSFGENETGNSAESTQDGMIVDKSGFVH